MASNEKIGLMVGLYDTTDLSKDAKNLAVVECKSITRHLVCASCVCIFNAEDRRMMDVPELIIVQTSAVELVARIQNSLCDFGSIPESWRFPAQLLCAQEKVLPKLSVFRQINL